MILRVSKLSRVKSEKNGQWVVLGSATGIYSYQPYFSLYHTLKGKHPFTLTVVLLRALRFLPTLLGRGIPPLNGDNAVVTIALEK